MPRKDYVDEGVVLELPEGVDAETKGFPTDEKYIKSVEEKKKSGYIRVIINFYLHEKGNKNKVISRPFVMKVYYTQEEADKQLADWNGNEWVPFTVKEHEFKREQSQKDGWAGFVTVKLKSWPSDPPVAWV